MITRKKQFDQEDNNNMEMMKPERVGKFEQENGVDEGRRCGVTSTSSSDSPRGDNGAGASPKGIKHLINKFEGGGGRKPSASSNAKVSLSAASKPKSSLDSVPKSSLALDNTKVQGKVSRTSKKVKITMTMSAATTTTTATDDKENDVIDSTTSAIQDCAPQPPNHKTFMSWKERMKKHRGRSTPAGVVVDEQQQSDDTFVVEEESEVNENKGENENDDTIMTLVIETPPVDSEEDPMDVVTDSSDNQVVNENELPETLHSTELPVIEEADEEADEEAEQENEEEDEAAMAMLLSLQQQLKEIGQNRKQKPVPAVASRNTSSETKKKKVDRRTPPIGTIEIKLSSSSSVASSTAMSTEDDPPCPLVIDDSGQQEQEDPPCPLLIDDDNNNDPPCPLPLEEDQVEVNEVQSASNLDVSVTSLLVGNIDVAKTASSFDGWDPSNSQLLIQESSNDNKGDKKRKETAEQTTNNCWDPFAIQEEEAEEVSVKDSKQNKSNKNENKTWMILKKSKKDTSSSNKTTTTTKNRWNPFHTRVRGGDVKKQNGDTSNNNKKMKVAVESNNSNGWDPIDVREIDDKILNMKKETNTVVKKSNCWDPFDVRDTDDTNSNVCKKDTAVTTTIAVAAAADTTATATPSQDPRTNKDVTLVTDEVCNDDRNLHASSSKNCDHDGEQNGNVVVTTVNSEDKNTDEETKEGYSESLTEEINPKIMVKRKEETISGYSRSLIHDSIHLDTTQKNSGQTIVDTISYSKSFMDDLINEHTTKGRDFEKGFQENAADFSKSVVEDLNLLGSKINEADFEKEFQEVAAEFSKSVLEDLNLLGSKINEAQKMIEEKIQEAHLNDSANGLGDCYSDEFISSVATAVKELFEQNLNISASNTESVIDLTNNCESKEEFSPEDQPEMSLRKFEDENSPRQVQETLPTLSLDWDDNSVAASASVAASQASETGRAPESNKIMSLAWLIYHDILTLYGVNNGVNKTTPSALNEENRARLGRTERNHEDEIPSSLAVETSLQDHVKEMDADSQVASTDTAMGNPSSFGQLQEEAESASPSVAVEANLSDYEKTVGIVESGSGLSTAKTMKTLSRLFNKKQKTKVSPSEVDASLPNHDTADTDYEAGEILSDLLHSEQEPITTAVEASLQDYVSQVELEEVRKRSPIWKILNKKDRESEGRMKLFKRNRKDGNTDSMEPSNRRVEVDENPRKDLVRDIDRSDVNEDKVETSLGHKVDGENDMCISPDVKSMQDANPEAVCRDPADRLSESDDNSSCLALNVETSLDQNPHPDRLSESDDDSSCQALNVETSLDQNPRPDRLSDCDDNSSCQALNVETSLDQNPYVKSSEIDDEETTLAGNTTVHRYAEVKDKKVVRFDVEATLEDHPNCEAFSINEDDGADNSLSAFCDEISLDDTSGEYSMKMQEEAETLNELLDLMQIDQKVKEMEIAKEVPKSSRPKKSVKFDDETVSTVESSPSHDSDESGNDDRITLNENSPKRKPKFSTPLPRWATSNARSKIPDELVYPKTVRKQYAAMSWLGSLVTSDDYTIANKKRQEIIEKFAADGAGFGANPPENNALPPTIENILQDLSFDGDEDASEVMSILRQIEAEEQEYDDGGNCFMCGCGEANPCNEIEEDVLYEDTFEDYLEESSAIGVDGSI